jgi:autotransporter-associated beta strand protein
MVNVGAGNKSGALVGAISGNNSAATNIPTAPNAGVLSVTKLGTGTQTLSGANIYTGATTVSAGTLLVNGSTHASSAVAVNGGGTLGGTGMVNGTTIVSGTGILAPGAATGNAVGTLNTATVTVTGGTYAVDLNGTLSSSDKINATGTVSLGAGVAALTIANATNSSAGKIYTIVNAVNVTGTFSGMPNGAIFTQAGRNFLITYTSTAVTLTDNAVNSTNPPLYQVGLRAEFFDSTTNLSVIPNLGVLVPDVVRTDAQIAYASVNTAWAGLPSTMVDTFSSRHSGWLKIDTAGTYTLFINSDDGSRVYLDGAVVIDNDGLHGMQERSVTLSLAAGFHQLRVDFFENTGGCGLEFSWSGPGIAKQLVPASALWQSPSSSVVGVPLPWIAADVGPVNVAGSANGNGVDFSITGGGSVALGTTSSTNITDYTLCANEGQSFALPGICDVAYGANGVYVFRNNLSGTVVFNNATFGDPISGVVKKGYYRLSGTQDAFQMVYRPLTSNGELIARVVSLENTNAAAKAGVMVRDSITASSVNAFMAISPTSGALFQSRTATGGATVSTLSAGTVAPYWVRVVRIGTTVTGWMSSDGITWTQVGAAVTLPLGATPMIGLGVTGGNNDLRALGIFDQVLFIPYAGG